METLTNGIITIGVNEHGAELASLRHNGREYLWQADKAFWARHSPVLFPIVGSVWNGEFTVDGKSYKMGQHGFARDMDFTLISKSEDEIKYRLTSSAETLERYPYQFILEIAYQLIGNTVRVKWHVENPTGELMHFQIGAHPAFYWPLLSNEEIDGGIEAMTPALARTDSRGYLFIGTKQASLPRSVVAEKGCIGGTATVELQESGYLPLTVQNFERDAMVFEDSLVDKVTICDADKRPYLSVEFTSPLVGIWSPPGKRAPFICIEPWYGRADSVGYTGEFKDRKWMQALGPKQAFDAWYDISLA